MVADRNPVDRLSSGRAGTVGNLQAVVLQPLESDAVEPIGDLDVLRRSTTAQRDDFISIASGTTAGDLDDSRQASPRRRRLLPHDPAARRRCGRNRQGRGDDEDRHATED
jgi:hypothetical protein